MPAKKPPKINPVPTLSSDPVSPPPADTVSPRASATSLSDRDRDRFAAAYYRAKAAMVQAQQANVAAEQARQTYVEANKAFMVVSKDVTAAYGLTTEDSINPDTGAIVRAPPKAPPAPPAAG